MKVLAIVLGSIAALVVLSLIALAILVPIAGKKMLANSNDPVKRRATLARIADFTVPPGFVILDALDLGVAQTATIVPQAGSGKYSMNVTLSSQHYPSTLPDRALLDQMSAALSLTEKIGGCNLEPAPDETIEVGGKSVTLRALSCARKDKVPLNVDVALVHAKASTVQIQARDVRTPDDRSALVALLRSMR